MRRATLLVLVTLAATTARAQTRKSTRATAPAPVQVRTNTFNAVSYGARPDGATDSGPAIQRAIDAAVEAAGAEGGAVVTLPGSSGAYHVAAPLLLKGRGVTFRGDGLGSQVRPAQGYEGPVLCVGLPARPGEIDADYRPDAFGVLDRSAAPQRRARRGLATRGKAGVLFQAHPFQLGGKTRKSPYYLPDYWSEAEALTVEFLLARPGGSVWKPWAPILGLSQRDQPAPWRLTFAAAADTLAFWFRSSEPDLPDSASYQFFVPIGDGPGPWRIAIQVGFRAGRFAAWVNGRQVAAKAGATPTAGHKFRPGLALHPHDGATAFHIGATNEKDVTDLVLHGLRVTELAVYRWDAADEVNADGPAAPVRDLERYFTSHPRTVALLPLDDPGGPPTVRATHGLGFWVPKGHRTDTQDVEVRDIHFRAAVSAPIVIGEHMGLKLRGVRATEGWQGVTRLPLSASYTLTMDDCTLGGNDCAFFSFRQTHKARNTTILRGGRDPVRVVGSGATWEHTFIATLEGYAETAFQFTGDDTGGGYRITDALVDNEAGGPLRALIAFEQGYSPAQRLTVDGLDVSAVSATAALFELTGHGTNQGWHPCRFEALNLGSWGPVKTALRVIGKPTFSGRLDASTLGGPLNVEGGDAAAKIQVIPRAFPP